MFFFFFLFHWATPEKLCLIFTSYIFVYYIQVISVNLNAVVIDKWSKNFLLLQPKDWGKRKYKTEMFGRKSILLYFIVQSVDTLRSKVNAPQESVCHFTFRTSLIFLRDQQRVKKIFWHQEKLILFSPNNRVHQSFSRLNKVYWNPPDLVWKGLDSDVNGKEKSPLWTSLSWW